MNKWDIFLTINYKYSSETLFRVSAPDDWCVFADMFNCNYLFDAYGESCDTTNVCVQSQDFYSQPHVFSTQKIQYGCLGTRDTLAPVVYIISRQKHAFIFIYSLELELCVYVPDVINVWTHPVEKCQIKILVSWKKVAYFISHWIKLSFFFLFCWFVSYLLKVF